MPIKNYSIPPSTTTTSSITTTTTTTVACNNPVFNLINGEFITRTQYSYLLSTLDTLLNKGALYINCHLCCPNCGNTYFFGNADRFVFFGNREFEYIPGDPIEFIKPECCVSIEGTQEIKDYITEAFSVDFNECTNSFSTCLQQIETYIGASYYQQLLAIGITEYSTVKGNTILCSLLQELQKSPVYSPLLVFNVLHIILNRGLVVHCDGSNVLVGGLDAYNNYLDAFLPLPPATPNN
jgi:hypothetical protein